MSVVKDGKSVGKLGQAQHFGERALLTREPVNADVVADCKCVLMTLQKGHFEALLGPLSNLLEREVAACMRF